MKSLLMANATRLISRSSAIGFAKSHRQLSKGSYIADRHSFVDAKAFENHTYHTIPKQTSWQKLKDEISLLRGLYIIIKKMGNPVVFCEVSETENHEKYACHYNKDGYNVCVELPGFTKEDLIIEIYGNVLLVKGPTKKAAYQEVNMTIMLPSRHKFNPEDVRAYMGNEEVKVVFPYLEEEEECNEKKEVESNEKKGRWLVAWDAYL